MCYEKLLHRQITHVERRLKGWMKPRSKAAGITGLPGKELPAFTDYAAAHRGDSGWELLYHQTFRTVPAYIRRSCKKIISRAFPEKYIATALGGKSPCIVTADSDVREAAKNIAYGKIMNSGQVCIAPDYALVDEKVKDQFWGVSSAVSEDGRRPAHKFQVSAHYQQAAF